MFIITNQEITAYQNFLVEEERSGATVEKYTRDVRELSLYLAGRSFGKAEVLAYKAGLIEKYAPASVNAALSSLNGFFRFMGWHSLHVKSLKIQRKIFLQKDKELTKAEYDRLLSVAEEQKNERLYLLMQTICASGIRVSELRYITVHAIRTGVAEISCKGKRRQVFLPRRLCMALREYVKKRGIHSGSVFVTRSGKPMDRSNIWSDMKRLCELARVSTEKVFPHNLRHLFARTYYGCQKDIVRLSDILGHSSVNTTRIYTMESGEIHARQIQRLGLLRC